MLVVVVVVVVKVARLIGGPGVTPHNAGFFWASLITVIRQYSGYETTRMWCLCRTVSPAVCTAIGLAFAA